MKLFVSCIPYDKGKSGISVYVREVVRELCRQGHELTLLCEPGEKRRERRFPEEGVPAGRDEARPFCQVVDDLGEAALSPLHEIRHVHAPRWTRRPMLSMLWHLFVLPFWIRRHRKEFDGFVICAANRRVCAWYPLPTTATVHDLANFHVSGKYSRLRMFYLAHVLPHFAKKAQRLVAVSGATKADMVRFWKCRDEDVTVLYNGLGENCSQMTIGTNVHKSQMANIDICGNGGNCEQLRFVNNGSILYISRIEHPGKNHVRLIEAYGRLPRTVAEAHPLVIAGADWKDAETVHAAAAASPHAAFIRFTGFVPEGDLEKLWDAAGFYVFPSLFEGFGLSLVEAMARGIPCACSNNGSLGEIAGDAALTFDPENVGEIADALLRLVSEPEQERSARIARGRDWVKRYSWADHAAGLVKLLEGAA